MLGIASLSVLLSYEKAIERLLSQWPRCWGLIAYAEDKATAEKLDKIRRRFQQDKVAGRALPSDWLEDNPWNACLRALAVDEEYWNEQVRHPLLHGWVQVEKECQWLQLSKQLWCTLQREMNCWTLRPT